MKYVRIASDLHLEQYYNSKAVKLAEKFIPFDDRDAESILVLAGDISSKIEQVIGFLAVLDRFQHIIYVPGNHEFYGHDMVAWEEQMLEQLIALPNVHFPGTTVKSVNIAGTDFVYGTLWGDGGNTDRDLCNVNSGLRDFYVTTIGGDLWTSTHMKVVNKTHRDLFDTLLSQSNNAIAVSHHMPSYRLCHPRFGPDLNGGFACNAEHILAYDHAPRVWIHGHTHDTIDTMLWKTRILCNPSGYYSENGSYHNQYAPMFFEL